MGPATPAFIGLMTVAAVGSVAVTVWLWPRLASQRIRMVAARLGLIAGGQVLVIAAILSFVNGYFSFFDSWSALVGSGSPPPAASAGIVASSRPITITGTDLGPAPGGGSALPELTNGQPASKPPHTGAAPGTGIVPGADVGDLARARSVGEVLQVTVRGEHTGIAEPGKLHLPAAAVFPEGLRPDPVPCRARADRVPERPVEHREAAHGSRHRRPPGRPGKDRPAVYVMMNVSVALPRDTECTNAPGGPQAQTFLAQDVPLSVERTFRVESGRSGWAVIGYSTGGYCAAKLAMMYPSQFSAAMSMAGYYTAIKDSTTGNLYGGSPAYQNENNLDWRLTHLPPPPVSVLVTSSRVGEKDLPGTLAFLRLIRPPMQGYSLIVAQGGHNYRTWNRQLPQSLEWIDQRLTPALPSAPRAGSGG